MNYNFTKGLYIDGKWQKGIETIQNINPSNIKQNIGDIAQASEKQTYEAIKAAKKAQKTWADTPLEHKVKVLTAIGDELIDRSDEIGELIAREEGKTKAEGRGEVYRSGQFFQYYAAEVLRQIGDNAKSVREGIDIEITREPIGVVGIISPWNFPVATPSWKIAPALAFGNSVIWKPSNLTPASAVALTEIISRQDMPAGTFNLVIGSGSSVGQQLITSKDIDAITFTGSVTVGKKVAVETASNLVKCQLEMGSKNSLVVANDADMQIAVESAITGAYLSAGQKCTASSRFIVMEDVYDEFIEKLTKKISTLKIGNALDKDVFMGPVIDQKQYESNFKWMKRAKELGAKLVFGGERLTLSEDGYYMSPALFIDTDSTWDINQEEIFGPIATVIKVKNLSEAIKVVNNTRFGLTSGIITQSLKTASIFKKGVETGCVMVNVPTAGTDYHVPFGGRKDSSYGSREQGTYAKEFYTVVKTAYQRSY